MYKKQKGCLVYLFKFVGMIMTLYFGVLMFTITLGLFRRISNTNQLLIGVLVSSIGFGFFMLAGQIITRIFPDVRVAKAGVKYRTYYHSKLIPWSEIEEITKVTSRKLFSNFYVLVINRKGAGMYNWKGLYAQLISGLLVGTDDPVILLSPSIDGREELINMIRKKIGEKG